MAGHIFLSYARRDGYQYVTRLEQDLSAAGYPVWRDKRNLNEYNDFSVEIEMGIRAASHVAVCVTPSLEQQPSSFVRREIIYAQSKQKPIIPLVFPQADVPILINHLTWIPFFDANHGLRYDDGLEELMKRLNEAPKSSAPPPHHNDPFRDYLTQMYDWIVSYLDKTVFSLLTLHSESTPDAVATTEEKPTLPMMFLDTFAAAAGIKEEKSAAHYQNFAGAFAAYEGRVLLLGEPGGGKTTTLMAFARDAIAKRLENPDEPLPILAPIATWDAYSQPPLATWLAGAVPALKKEMQQTIAAGQALLLLDGLDELGSERPVDPQDRGKGFFDPRLAFMRFISTDNKLVITCRIKDYSDIGEKLPLKGAVTLESLTDFQLRDYLSQLPELWDALQKDDYLRDVARTPLLLSLFTFAFAESDEELKQLRDLSQGDLRDKIFETYVKRRYEHEQRKPHAALPMTFEAFTHALGHIAVHMVSYSNHVVIDRHSGNMDGFLTSELHDLAIKLHIFVREENGNLRFIHLLLRDYFAFRQASYYLKFSTDIAYRRRAASGFNTLKDIRAVQVLLEALQDADGYVRMYTIETLAQLNYQPAIEPIIQSLALYYDYGDEDFAHACYALKLFGDVTYPRLVDMLYSENDILRYAAATALADIGKPALHDLLTAAKSTNIYVRCGAMNSLGRLEFSEALTLEQRDDIVPTISEALIHNLSDENWCVREFSVHALKAWIEHIKHIDISSKITEVEAAYTTEEMIAALKLDDSRIRMWAAMRLIPVKSPQIIPAILKAFRTERRITTMQYYLIALHYGDIMDEESISELVAICNENTFTRFVIRGNVITIAEKAGVKDPETLAILEKWRKEREKQI